MNARKSAFLTIALADLAVLQGLTLWADSLWSVTYDQTFIYLVITGMAAKLVGDAVYYILYPDRKRWLYLEDYVLNELLVHTRFIVPLAVAQGYVAVQAPVFVPLAWILLRRVWISPLLAVVLWAVNRHLVELADARRNPPIGVHAAALVAGRQESAGPQSGDPALRRDPSRN